MSSTPSLGSLTPPQLRLLTFQILTEHFSISPETLAKMGADSANQVYDFAIKQADDAFRAQLQATYGDDEDRMRAQTGLDWREFELGMVRLETLIESAIDKRFDLFELFLLRNVFSIPVDLIPYLVLSHQNHFSDDLRAADEQALLEYEQEAALYEQELENARALSATQEFVARKLEAVQARQTEIGYLKGSESLSSDTQGLLSQLSLLQSRLQTLLDTPAPPTVPQEGPTSAQVNESWAKSRAAFVNWAASEKVAKAARGAKEEGGLGGLQGEQESIGRSEAAQALLAYLSR